MLLLSKKNTNIKKSSSCYSEGIFLDNSIRWRKSLGCLSWALVQKKGKARNPSVQYLNNLIKLAKRYIYPRWLWALCPVLVENFKFNAIFPKYVSFVRQLYSSPAFGLFMLVVLADVLATFGKYLTLNRDQFFDPYVFWKVVWYLLF